LCSLKVSYLVLEDVANGEIFSTIRSHPTSKRAYALPTTVLWLTTVLPPPRNQPQLANVLSSEALFYTCIIPFIIFFGSFAGLLYPMRDVLHPTGE